ncbi:hypothetical protein RchiOBHm_Chr4g0439761 [Rosa chinensis]|uniref:Uncharacterized protein n=1 Tax=Rosa chinensis TaxID=74649 RepID=A0A2P6R2W8_ROSCH|nr:hypothetical protein RchiOBHm_Chr4g0439761 [Rosa chinensis]
MSTEALRVAYFWAAGRYRPAGSNPPKDLAKNTFGLKQVELFAKYLY